MDAIRDKFGRGAIQPGSVIGNDIGVDVGGIEDMEQGDEDKGGLSPF